MTFARVEGYEVVNGQVLRQFGMGRTADRPGKSMPPLSACEESSVLAQPKGQGLNSRSRIGSLIQCAFSMSPWCSSETS